jgi:Protein of unknown function (DUF3618)
MYRVDRQSIARSIASTDFNRKGRPPVASSEIRSVPLEPNRAVKSPAELEADIESTRERLAGTIDAIADRVAPANVARRAVDRVRSQFVEPDGALRTQRVLILAAGVAVVVGLAVWRRSR